MIKEKSQGWNSISLGIGKLFGSMPLSANGYTILTLLFSLASIPLAMAHHYVLCIICHLLSAILDNVDGAVARYHDKTSAFGAFMDGTFDRVSDYAMLFCYFYFPIQAIGFPLGQWILLAAFGVIMPTFMVAYANHRKATDDDDEKLIWRLMNRGEMFFLMLLAPVLSLFNPAYAGWALLIFVLLSFITTVQTYILVCIKKTTQ